MRFTYDRPADTLFVDFYGEARPAASIPLDRGDRDFFYMRIDPETDAIVGLQIEHFLSYATKRHRELIGALDADEGRGIEREEIDRIVRARSGHAKTGHHPSVLKTLMRLRAYAMS